jgi:ribokinase
MYDVVSLGSATLDVFLKVPELVVIPTKEVFTGEALLLPYGGKCEVGELYTSSGGGGTNTAVGFARLGLSAAVVARCGWDFGGRQVRQEIKKEKVDDNLLIQLEGESTDYSTIIIGPDGRVAILVHRGKTRLEKSLIDFKKLQARWFCISHLEGNLDLLAEILSFARKNKIKVAFNPGRKEIEKKEALLPLIKNLDLLVVNQEEAARLLEASYFDPKIFRQSAKICSGLVAVTRGAEGAYLFDRQDRLLKAEGFKIEMVDATGAGDAFFCGLVAGLLKNWPLEKALKLGLANGASVASFIGTKTGLLSLADYHNWLEKPLKISWQK